MGLSFTKPLLKGRWFMEPLERAKLLLAKARDDETVLEEIISNEKIRDEIIGFHAQQAAEKLLKALLMAKNIPYRRTPYHLLQLNSVMITFPWKKKTNLIAR